MNDTTIKIRKNNRKVIDTILEGTYSISLYDETEMDVNYKERSDNSGIKDLLHSLVRDITTMRKLKITFESGKYYFVFNSSYFYVIKSNYQIEV